MPRGYRSIIRQSCTNHVLIDAIAPRLVDELIYILGGAKQIGCRELELGVSNGVADGAHEPRLRPLTLAHTGEADDFRGHQAFPFIAYLYRCPALPPTW